MTGKLPLRRRDLRGDGAVLARLDVPLHDLQGHLGRSRQRRPVAFRRTRYSILTGRELITTYQPDEGTAKSFCCGLRLQPLRHRLARLRGHGRPPDRPRRALRGQSGHAHLRSLGSSVGDAPRRRPAPLRRGHAVAVLTQRARTAERAGRSHSIDACRGHGSRTSPWRMSRARFRSTPTTRPAQAKRCRTRGTYGAALARCSAPSSVMPLLCGGRS